MLLYILIYKLVYFNAVKMRYIYSLYFSKILLKIYNLFRIKERYKWKTAFKIKFEHFEYLILLFGFINILTIFQIIINHILKEYIDRIVVVYLNDIFIFNKTLEKYKNIYILFWQYWNNSIYISIYTKISSIVKKSIT